MFSESNPPNSTQQISAPTSLWLRRLIISLTLLVWLALFAALLWAIGQVSRAFILLAIGATIATVVHPLARLLERRLPRPIAVGAIYLFIFALVSVLFYFLVNVIIEQVLSLIQYIQRLISPNGQNQWQPILETLRRIGITQRQLQSFEQQLISQLEGLVNNTLPFVSNLFNVILNIIFVALLSIYLLFSGPSTVHRLRHNTPKRIRGGINFLLDTLEQTIGSNFRGILLLAVIISTLTGIGLFFIGVPYPILLSTVAFVMEFIPFVGFYITAVTIVLFALTQGWTTALIAVAFVVVLQTIEGEILSPRIVGGAVGINPVIAILAIVAGSQLYGILGAFFAAPVAGFIQAILLALWSQWKESHPDQFSQEEKKDQPQDGPNT
jgi:predicted PurR-regulated permease PerM